MECSRLSHSVCRQEKEGGLGGISSSTWGRVPEWQAEDIADSQAALGQDSRAVLPVLGEEGSQRLLKLLG